MRLKGRTAIITGAASGLGRAMADRLADEGATIVVADIDDAAIETAVAELGAAGHTAIGVRTDVTDRAQQKALMQACIDRFGRIDILVNNAGLNRSRPFLTMDSEDWNIVLDVDLKGVFFGAQAVAEHMIRQKYGKIVNISSVSGTGAGAHGLGGSEAGNINYEAAKAGVIQITKTLARELGPHGINVNSVAPGFILTPMTARGKTKEQLEAHIETRRRVVVLKRSGTPREIANAVLFLASDEASFITGHTLHVDGGRIDRM